MTHFRTALIALALGLYADNARSAVVGVELQLHPAETLKGRGCFVRVKVNNVGSTNVNSGSVTLLVESGGGRLLLTKVEGSIPAPFNSSGTSTITYHFYAVESGPVRLTGNFKGTEAGTGAVVNVSSPTGTVSIGDDAANLPARGTFQIRNNVIRPSKSNYYPPRTMMYLMVSGPPGGMVQFFVHGPSGMRVGQVGHGQEMGGSTKEFVLDGSGNTVVPYDAVIDGQLLETGPYWMVISGAVAGKQPFMVVRQE